MIAFRHRHQWTLIQRSVRHNARAHKRGLRADLSAAQIRDCIAFWGHACCFCGREVDELDDLSLDHYQPISAPNSVGSTVTNILPACKACNVAKDTQDAATWLYATFSAPYARATLALIDRYFEQISQEQRQ